MRYGDVKLCACAYATWLRHGSCGTWLKGLHRLVVDEGTLTGAVPALSVIHSIDRSKYIIYDQMIKDALPPAFGLLLRPVRVPAMLLLAAFPR